MPKQEQKGKLKIKNMLHKTVLVSKTSPPEELLSKDERNIH